MIVNQHQKGWEVIYHRAHALLAAEIAAQWNVKERPMRWLETIAAISHHDDLEKEWEGKHITDAGAPLDFTLIKDTKASDVASLRELANNARYRGHLYGKYYYSPHSPHSPHPYTLFQVN